MNSSASNPEKKQDTGTASGPSPSLPRGANSLPPPPPEVLAGAVGVRHLTVEWLAGDGSDRCYYRLQAPGLQHPLVLMQLSGPDAQALKANGYDWLRIGGLLTARGIYVPRVVTTLPEHAALVIEDYGNDMLESVVRDAHAEGTVDRDVTPLYDRCSQMVAKFLGIAPSPDAPWCSRSFDQARFQWELEFFYEKFVGPYVPAAVPKNQDATYRRDCEKLSGYLAGLSAYFVHRDFHSRNLMVQNGKLAVLDFQDARLGPAAYDLVSLTFDPYVPFSTAFREELLERGITIIERETGPEAAQQIRESWRAVLLQRQLKAIGSYGFLTRDKQRGDYLQYVPPALKTLMELDLSDERWPYLSGAFLESLGRHVNEALR